MVESILLQTALCLPAPDVEALAQGRMIVAMPRRYINPGQQFVLCPVDVSFPWRQYYYSSFFPTVQTSLAQLTSQTVLIKTWARCETCQMPTSEAFDILSQSTVWTKQGLLQALGQRPNIFLAYLRVYDLLEPLEISLQLPNRHFVALSRQVKVGDTYPVLTDTTFAARKHRLEELQPPLHRELEELEGALTPITNPAAKQLEQDIQIFLGWRRPLLAASDDIDLSWIHKIAEVGNSSDGHSFEKLVRKSLLKLGFTGSGLDPEGSGGAGGMDFYCEYPYPVVGECKATKSEKVPDSTPAQLLKIGMNHLGKTQYENAVKLIVAAGELNSFAKRTATENGMNVITPETLQKLVELQANYKNSINLLELKECLQQAPFGIADEKVNKYIDKINQDIKLRAQLVELVKKYLENTGYERASVDALHGFVAGASIKIQPRELHEILVELSSPLAGYLGRIKGEDWRRDRFYFLRDLLIS
ncbi:hypothetical protein CAL7716_063340 [Calothrix sp. PCC 7716]|nr:hypothetical protein CAL7716_063340 [Calothrix sp. PCC 7716]